MPLVLHAQPHLSRLQRPRQVQVHAFSSPRPYLLVLGLCSRASGRRFSWTLQVKLLRAQLLSCQSVVASSPSFAASAKPLPAYLPLQHTRSAPPKGAPVPRPLPRKASFYAKYTLLRLPALLWPSLLKTFLWHQLQLCNLLCPRQAQALFPASIFTRSALQLWVVFFSCAQYFSRLVRCFQVFKARFTARNSGLGFCARSRIPQQHVTCVQLCFSFKLWMI